MEHGQTIQNILQISGMKKHYKCPKPVSHKLFSQGYLASLLSLHLVVLAMYIILLVDQCVNTKGT